MQKTLRKVLEELNKENPKLDYIRGMLEVLVDEPENIIWNPDKDKLIVSNHLKDPMYTPGTINAVENDEGAMLDAQAAQAMKGLNITSLEIQ